MIEDPLASRLGDLLAHEGADLWGFADVRGLPRGDLARYPTAVSFAHAMEPGVMATVVRGPNRAYAELYAQVNDRLDALSVQIVRAIEAAGYAAHSIPASKRTDPQHICGDFPHKTAATRCGLGWIGRNAQLVTRRFGPWVRLGTVLTDAPLPAMIPTTRHSCGRCTACVEACPAQALPGGSWHPGVVREDLLDAARCDAWKKAHYPQFHGGHNCGICAAVCPYGRRSVSRRRGGGPGGP